MGLLVIAGGSLSLSSETSKEKTKKMDVSSKKKERYCRSILFDQNDLSLTDKKDLRKHQRMNILAAIPILLFYLNKN